MDFFIVWTTVVLLAVAAPTPTTTPEPKHSRRPMRVNAYPRPVLVPGPGLPGPIRQFPDHAK